MDLKELQLLYPKKEIGTANDLSNKKFGKWTVLYRTENDGPNTMWVCECSCEKHTQKPVRTKSLLSGRSTSCGCHQKEVTSNRTD